MVKVGSKLKAVLEGYAKFFGQIHGRGDREGLRVVLWGEPHRRGARFRLRVGLRWGVLLPAASCRASSGGRTAGLGRRPGCRRG